MRRRLLAPAILVAALGACVTASVESHPISPADLYAPGKGDTLEGVIFYQPRPYMLTYVFTQFDPAVSKNPADKNVPATDSCWRTVQHTELLILPDFAHPRIMTPVRHGIGTVKLSVTMSGGIDHGGQFGWDIHRGGCTEGDHRRSRGHRGGRAGGGAGARGGEAMQYGRRAVRHRAGGLGEAADPVRA